MPQRPFCSENRRPLFRIEPMKIASSSSSPFAVVVAMAAVAAGSLGACSGLRLGGIDETQALVNGRITGMSVGDFADRYGATGAREPGPDNSLAFSWESSVGATPPGPFGQDDRVCRLRVLADKNGRIVSARIVDDYVGRVSASRCGELFR